jgi:hypothetical protein
MSRFIFDDNIVVKVDGSHIGEQKQINFIPGKNVSITGLADSNNDVVNVTITGTDQINQTLNTDSSPTFAALTVKGDIATDGKVDGVDVSAHAADSSIHHLHTNKTNLDNINQDIGSASSPTFAGLTVKGDIATDGKVDGVDVSSHASRHLISGADALTGSLDANARVQVNTNGTAAGTRRTLNFIAGENVKITTSDDSTNEVVNLTLSTTNRNNMTVWVGDASCPDLISAANIVGKANINIPNGNYAISADLSFDADKNIFLHPGAKICITGTGTELYFGGRVVCSGGPHFNLDASCMVIFGNCFEAEASHVFQGLGAVNGVKFGLGVQLVINRMLLDSSHWSAGAGWTISSGMATAANVPNGSFLAQSTTVALGQQHWARLNLVNYSSGTVIFRVGNTTSVEWNSPGWKEDIISAVNPNPIWVTGGASPFNGSVSNISVRKVLGGCVKRILPQWWGAVGDGITDCSDAIQAAINAAAQGRYDSRLCNMVYLLAGRYVITKRIYFKPWVSVIAEGQTTEFFVGDPISGTFNDPDNRVFVIDSTYGGFGGGTRGYHLLAEGFKINATRCINNDLYLFHFTDDFAWCKISQVRFEGNFSKNVRGIYLGTTGNFNSSVFDGLGFKNCNSSDGAFFSDFNTSGNNQQMIIRNCNFNNANISLKLCGPNNIIKDNNFEAAPDGEQRVKRRGALKSNILSIVKGVQTRINWNDIGYPVPSNGKILINNINDINWSNLNGLHSAVSGGIGYAIINVDTSSYPDYNSASMNGTLERIGGKIFRSWIQGHRNNFMGNYFDGGLIYTNIFGAMNASTGSTNVPVILSSPNPGMDGPDGLSEMLVNLDNTIMNFPGTYVAQNQLTAPGDLRGRFYINNYLWLNLGDYGWIKGTVNNVVYSGGITTITLTEPLLRNDLTSISIYPTPTSLTSRIVYNEKDTINSAYIDKIRVGVSPMRSGNTIQQIRRIKYTSTSGSVTAGGKATITIPVTGLVAGGSTDYMVFITPAAILPSDILICNTSLNIAVNTASFVVKNEGTLAWDYSNKVWNLMLIYFNDN